jgi:carbamate kinase
MGPKVEAAAIFAESTGLSALISSIEQLRRALEGDGGTWVDP